MTGGKVSATPHQGAIGITPRVIVEAPGDIARSVDKAKRVRDLRPE